MIRKLIQIVLILIPTLSFAQWDEDSLLTVGYINVLETIVADSTPVPIYIDPEIRMKNPPAEVNGKKLVVLDKRDHYAFRDKISPNSIIYTIYHIKITDSKYSINLYPEIFTGKMIYDGSSYDPELVKPKEVANNAFNIELIFKFMTPKGENNWELWDTCELEKIR